MNKSSFVKASVLTDSLAVRCAEFNPGGECESWKWIVSNSEPCLHRVPISGNLYAVGSNSRNVYICVSNSENEIKSQIDGDNSRPAEAKIIKTLSKHHKGSIYCLRYIICM